MSMYGVLVVLKYLINAFINSGWSKSILNIIISGLNFCISLCKALYENFIPSFSSVCMIKDFLSPVNFVVINK